jgi:hypothetical protein
MIDPIALQAHLESRLDAIQRENEILAANNRELRACLERCQDSLRLLCQPVSDCQEQNPG